MSRSTRTGSRTRADSGAGPEGRLGSFTRSCLLWAVTTTGVLTTLVLLADDLPRSMTLERRRLEAVPFDALLAGGCAVALAACACWLWLVTTLVTLEALTGLPLWRAGCPDGLRRALLAACGVALVGGFSPALPASADTSAGLPPAPTGSERTVLDGLQLPDRPSIEDATRAARQPRPSPLPGTHTDRRVRVRTGDTLWDLARAQLPPDATDTAIDRGWRRIWSANRDVVRDDPDLIHPGSVLRMPDQKEHR